MSEATGAAKLLAPLGKNAVAANKPLLRGEPGRLVADFNMEQGRAIDQSAENLPDENLPDSSINELGEKNESSSRRSSSAKQSRFISSRHQMVLLFSLAAAHDAVLCVSASPLRSARLE